MRMDDKTGGPAFPGQAQSQQEQDINEGMTLRDYFAAKLMPMQLAKEVPSWEAYNYENAAVRCYKMADAMLKVRRL